jgi:hypothetical protein
LKAWWFLVVAFALGACGHPGGRHRPSPPAELVGLQYVHAEDGIDPHEAMTIAREYMSRYISSCGAPDDVVRRGETWVVSLLLGATGRRYDDAIEIDAKTGGISSEGGPSFRDFSSFATAKGDPGSD